MIEDDDTWHPLQEGVNCVSEDKWGGNIQLPKYENLSYDELTDTPSMAYVVGYLNAISLPICLDTGAGKSLMSLESWSKINANDTLELKPQFRGFEAVNGSRISCKGSALIKLMLMGEEMNYVGYFRFFIVDALAIDALLGIDEIFRHGIRINASEGFACQDQIGKFKTNLVFKPPYDISYGHTFTMDTIGVLYGARNEEDDEQALEMGISIEPDDMVESCDFGLDDTKLSNDERERAKSLISEYKDLFQWGEGPLSCAHKYEHEIRLLPGAKPVKHKNRRFSVDQQKLINEEVEKLLKQGIVEKSNSPWASRIVLAWNHYKQKHRVCLDLRDLNARSLADNYPLPNLQDLLNKLVGGRYFTTLDLYQGFHQYNLKPSCREYTAFQTPRHGLVQYVRVPFGAKTAPNGFETGGGGKGLEYG